MNIHAQAMKYAKTVGFKVNLLDKTKVWQTDPNTHDPPAVDSTDRVHARNIVSVFIKNHTAFCVVTFCISSVSCDNLFFTYFKGDHELYDVYPF